MQGLIETVAANTPRFDHNPVSKVSLGLLVEEARTNLMLQSQNVTLAPWTTLLTPVINPTSTIAPDGTLTMNSINDNNGAGFEAVVQQIAIPDDSAIYTLSMFIEKTPAGTAPTMGVNIVLIGGTNPGDLPIPRIFTDTGFVQDLQAGANSRIEDAGDYWRLISTVGNNSTGHTIYEVQVYPATAANGFLPNVAAAVGINRVWGHLVELGAFALSYIPTTGGVVLRAGDVVSMTDMSWLAATQTFFAHIKTGNIDNDTTVWSLHDGTADERIAIEITGGNMHFIGVDGGVTQWDISTAAAADTEYRIAVAWAVNDIVFYLNGSQIGVDSLATLPTLTTLNIGSDHADAEFLNSHFKEDRGYNVRKDNQFLEDLSNGLITEEELSFLRPLVRPIPRPLV